MEETRSVLLGQGEFNWPRHERITDRYGSFGLYSGEGRVPFSHTPEGRGFFEVEIIETRPPTHIGDILRGIYPTQPKVGDVFTFGPGEFFSEVDEDELAPWFGLKPDDGREADWLDPNRLYRCHAQTVRVFWRPETAAETLHEYAFDTELRAVIRVMARSEAEAIELLRTVSGDACQDGQIDIGDPLGRPGLCATLTEFSVAEVTTLFEVDGEPVDDEPHGADCPTDQECARG